MNKKEIIKNSPRIPKRKLSNVNTEDLPYKKRQVGDQNVLLHALALRNKNLAVDLPKTVIPRTETYLKKALQWLLDAPDKQIQLDILSVDMLCKSHIQSLSTPVRSTRSILVSALMGYSGAMILAILSDQFLDIQLNPLISNAIAGTSVLYNYISTSPAKETQSQEVCKALYSLLCKNEGIVPTMKENVQIRTLYLNSIYSKYNVHLDLHYYVPFWNLVNSGQIDSMDSDFIHTLKEVYAAHPKTAFGFALYYLMVSSTLSTENDKKKCTSKFSKTISSLLVFSDTDTSEMRVKKIEAFKNAITSLFTGVLVTDRSVQKALTVLMHHIMTVRGADNPLLKFYYQIVWIDFHETTKKRLERFCNENPNLCVKSSVEEMV